MKKAHYILTLRTTLQLRYPFEVFSPTGKDVSDPPVPAEMLKVIESVYNAAAGALEDCVDGNGWSAVTHKLLETMQEPPSSDEQQSMLRLLEA